MIYTWTKIIRGESTDLKDIPEGAAIDTVDDKDCWGRCEGCGRPIVEGERYASDEDGGFLCKDCLDAES